MYLMSNKISDIKSNEDLQYSNNKCTYKKLLSIHLQSNNPDNFRGFIKSLEDNLIDLNLIEVIVKIDDDDTQMNDLLSDLVKSSPINLKYISTPLLGNFSDLWRSMNDMLLVCEKDSYFLWNMNDEMRIPIKGWDQKLKKYVGMFPDNLFRLRTSVFRNRNYTDEWECCFSPETSAITTKKWIETCGDWNPTLGPDTFNQLVAYYFSYHDRFNKDKEIRDIVINDFNFIGEGAFLGLTKKQRMKRISETIKPWFKLISYKTLLEASRRSQKIKANIYIEKVFKGHHEAEKGRISGSEIKGYFIDIGTPESLNHANKLPWLKEAKAVVFDRDGTLNVDNGYTHKVSDLVWNPGAISLIRYLNDSNVLVFVATNQAGIAKDIFKEKDMHHFHAEMQKQLRKNGAHIDEFFYCPYHIDGSIPKYSIESENRKPKTGMLQEISVKWKIKKDNMLLIGDRDTDIKCADNFNISSIKYNGLENLLNIKDNISRKLILE